MTPKPTLLWFRRDLRLRDHPALSLAVSRGGPLLPIYIDAPEEEGEGAAGQAGRWWLSQSLKALDSSLKAAGSRLLIRQGPSEKALLDLARESGAVAVIWSRILEPEASARDQRVAAALVKAGLEVFQAPPDLLTRPETLLNGSGKPYQVFTPFYQSLLERGTRSELIEAPKKLPAPERWPAQPKGTEGKPFPSLPWTRGLASAWTPGEAGAAEALQAFLEGACARYADQRDRPDLQAVSRLSPHLRWGELSVLRAWAAASRAAEAVPGLAKGAEAWKRQLAWREFAAHLLHHFPQSARAPLRPEFERFPWSDARKGEASRLFRAWKEGRTGCPFVDAGMRELWATGTMHNRARMAAASYLVKDLLISWREGAAWFRDTLVDFDLANNTLGWQWTAGCGADAAPFFRIFNPELQRKKFDPKGDYTRRWIKETESEYPPPIIDHALARRRALAAFKTI